jgi:hypothetical protein
MKYIFGTSLCVAIIIGICSCVEYIATTSRLLNFAEARDACWNSDRDHISFGCPTHKEFAGLPDYVVAPYIGAVSDAKELSHQYYYQLLQTLTSIVLLAGISIVGLVQVRKINTSGNSHENKPMKASTDSKRDARYDR